MRRSHLHACVLLAGYLLTTPTTPVAAQQAPELVRDGGLSRSQLAHFAQALGASDGPVRKGAFEALGRLSPSSLPAAREHFASLLAPRPTREEALRVLTAFRRAAGSKRADDETDLALGVLRVLETERSQTVLVMAQSLLFLRSLEAQTEPSAHLELARFVDLDQGAWESELKLVRKRGGLKLLPALLQLRSHEAPSVRRFAQAGVSQLGLEDPTLALATADARLLTQLLNAYVNPPDYAAMPLIVRMVNDPRTQVRQAARAAVDRYGKNAIWQVRELYEEVSSRSADKRWNFEQSRDALYAFLDRDAVTEAQQLLQRGLASFVDGKLDAMQHDFDTLLAKHPSFPERAKLAPGYAAVGDGRLASDELTGALDAYRRALRLDPHHADAKRWQARIAYAYAELALTDGVVDLAAYDRALALDPDFGPALVARDTLNGERARKQQAHKRYAALAALALLLAIAALMLLRRPSPTSAQFTPESQ